MARVRNESGSSQRLCLWRRMHVARLLNMTNAKATILKLYSINSVLPTLLPFLPLVSLFHMAGVDPL